MDPDSTPGLPGIGQQAPTQQPKPVQQTASVPATSPAPTSAPVAPVVSPTTKPTTPTSTKSTSTPVSTPTLSADQIAAFDKATGLTTAPNANPQNAAAVSSRVSQLQALAKGATPATDSTQKTDQPGADQGFMGNVFGTGKGNWFEGLLNSTIGNGGIGGQVAGPIISALTSGAEKGDADSKTELANVTQTLIKKIGTMTPTDPQRASLMQIVQENQKAMGIANDTMASLEANQETQEQNLARSVNAASTLAMGAGSGAGAAADAGEAALEKAGMSTGEKAATIGGKAMEGAATGAGFGAAQGAAGQLENNADAADVLKGGAEGAAAGAATGGALGAAGQIVGKAGSAILAPFKGSYLPAVQDAFDEQGIKAPLGAITKSPIVRLGEGALSMGQFGQKIMDTYSTASDAIDKKTNEVIDSIKPAKTLSDENLGKSIQQGLKNYDDNFRQTEDKVYDTFGKTYGKAPTTAATTKDMLGTIMKEQSGDYFKGIDPALSRMTDKLTGMNSPEAKALLEQGFTKSDIIDKGMVSAPDLTFNELKSTRTSIGEQLSRDPENTALKRLYGSLSTDMETAVKKVSPDGAKALSDLNGKYASGMQKIESNVAQSIKQSNPESLAQNLFKRNSADTINQVKEIIGPNAFGDTQKAFTRNLFDGATSDKTGNFDVSKMKSALGNYDDETLNAIYTPQQRTLLTNSIDQLQKLQDLRDSMKGANKITGGSQTAYLLKAGNLIGRSSSFLTALASGNFTLAGSLLAETGGEYAGSKFITSDLGRSYLTKGLGGNAGTWGAAAQRAAQVATPTAAKIAGEVGAGQNNQD